MGVWEWVGVVVLAVIAVSVPVALFVGRVIRLRDSQVRPPL